MPIIGSNTGFCKVASVPFFPVLLSFALPYIAKDVIFKRFLISIVCVLIVCVVPLRRNVSLLDAGMIRAKHMIEIPKYRGIRTTEIRKACIETLDAYINSHLDREIIFVSDYAERNLGYYLMDKMPNNNFHNWELGLLNNDKYINSIKDQITYSSNKISIVVIYQEESSKRCLSKLEKVLCDKNAKIECEYPLLRMYAID